MEKKPGQRWIQWLNPVASLTAAIARLPDAVGGLASGGVSPLLESLAWVVVAVVGSVPVVRWGYEKLPPTRLRKYAPELREVKVLLTKSPQDYVHPNVDVAVRMASILGDVGRIAKATGIPQDRSDRKELLLALVVPVENGRVKEVRQAFERFGS